MIESTDKNIKNLPQSYIDTPKSAEGKSALSLVRTVEKNVTTLLSSETKKFMINWWNTSSNFILN